jgi:hypothetical protein
LAKKANHTVAAFDCCVKNDDNAMQFSFK